MPHGSHAPLGYPNPPSATPQAWQALALGCPFRARGLVAPSNWSGRKTRWMHHGDWPSAGVNFNRSPHECCGPLWRRLNTRVTSTVADGRSLGSDEGQSWGQDWVAVRVWAGTTGAESVGVEIDCLHQGRLSLVPATSYRGVVCVPGSCRAASPRGAGLSRCRAATLARVVAGRRVAARRRAIPVPRGDPGPCRCGAPRRRGAGLFRCRAVTLARVVAGRRVAAAPGYPGAARRPWPVSLRGAPRPRVALRRGAARRVTAHAYCASSHRWQPTYVAPVIMVSTNPGAAPSSFHAKYSRRSVSLACSSRRYAPSRVMFPWKSSRKRAERWEGRSGA